MLTAIALTVLSIPKDPGYERLLGRYEGPMFFHDESDGKDKSFVVGLEITADPNADTANWNWRFNYNPPQYAESLEKCFAADRGRTWKETTDKEELRFKLKGWSNFSKGKSDWFEIERVVKKGMIGGDNVGFRRRYTLTSEMLKSEKWLKYPGKDWTFSHRMELKRVMDQESAKG